SARVQVVLTEKALVPEPTKEPTLSERSASGFKQSLSAIGDFLKDMVVSMAIIAPAVIGVAIVGVIVSVIVICIRKCVRKKKIEDDGKEE
ncbi:MAG: hypothetical protein IJD86_00350, partial [Clostridia bacterium]|nr:hypothetical protein [Clostridia bacterium]